MRLQDNISTPESSPGDSAVGMSHMTYIEKEDIIPVSITDEHEASSVDLASNIMLGDWLAKTSQRSEQESPQVDPECCCANSALMAF